MFEERPERTLVAEAAAVDESGVASLVCPPRDGSRQQSLMGVGAPDRADVQVGHAEIGEERRELRAQRLESLGLAHVEPSRAGRYLERLGSHQSSPVGWNCAEVREARSRSGRIGAEQLEARNQLGVRAKVSDRFQKGARSRGCQVKDSESTTRWVVNRLRVRIVETPLADVWPVSELEWRREAGDPVERAGR
jgi:hypothetical protein